MADEQEAVGLGCESGGVAAEANQQKGAASKKKNKWKTVTAEFYQPKPYESDQGKGKGGSTKGAGKGGSSKAADDSAARVGRGGKGGPPQDDARPTRSTPEDDAAKQSISDATLSESDTLGAKGGSGDDTPKRKSPSVKPRDLKGKGKSKQASPIQPRAAPHAKGGQLAAGPGQQSAMMQQMLPQGATVPLQFAPVGVPGAGMNPAGGVMYQNTPVIPAMYAMPYYVPVQMAPAQMVGAPAMFTSPPSFLPTGAPGVPGAAMGSGSKMQQPPPADEGRMALRAQVQQQIEYYFDGKNLVNDMYLRRSMSDEGWVAVWLVAGFRRVQNMTMDLSLVVEAIQASSKLELDIQKQFVRPKDSWQQWVGISAGAGVPPREMPEGDLPGSAGPP